jgi:hypothetical protein
MRKIILTILLVFIAHICTAPELNFRLRMIRLQSAIEFAERKYHESELSRFVKDLGYRESGNNWMSINLIGCFGEWQFAESTLKYLGFTKITLKKFRAHPDIFPRDLQLEALKTLIKVNLALLSDYEHFIGDSIRGIPITRSGMIAAAHLGGAGTLQKFLSTRGSIDRQDVLGTSISDYLKEFCSYDLN